MAIRKWFALVVGLATVTQSGCALLHELQPHRLRRLNRVPAPHLDPEFTQAEPPAGSKLIARAQSDANDGAAALDSRR